MDIEKEIISYLVKYGNTRESSMKDYETHVFNYSPRDMKKIRSNGNKRQNSPYCP